jgi:hypothetical protein
MTTSETLEASDYTASHTAVSTFTAVITSNFSCYSVSMCIYYSMFKSARITLHSCTPITFHSCAPITLHSCKSAHEQTQTPLSNDTIDSVPRHREVGRAKDLSAPSRTAYRRHSKNASSFIFQSGIATTWQVQGL